MSKQLSESNLFEENADEQFAPFIDFLKSYLNMSALSKDEFISLFYKTYRSLYDLCVQQIRFERVSNPDLLEGETPANRLNSLRKKYAEHAANQLFDKLITDESHRPLFTCAIKWCLLRRLLFLVDPMDHLIIGEIREEIGAEA